MRVDEGNRVIVEMEAKGHVDSWLFSWTPGATHTFQPTTLKVASRAAATAMQVVVQPSFRERSHPLAPMLKSNVYIPSRKLRSPMSWARRNAPSGMTPAGALGLSPTVSIVNASTATMKAHADRAVEEIAQLAKRESDPEYRRVPRNVAENPPRNALTKATCLAMSSR
jgi:hypothetical protein